MAKWKNALLISTIVAPIAFGAGPIGDALADATKPSTTTVKLHKYVTDSETDYNSTKYWGNGTTTDSANPMTDANGKWTLGDKATFEFDAYQIPDKAITLHKDGDISFNTVNGVNYGNLLQKVDASATRSATSFTADQYAADGVLSKYSIEVKEGKLADLQAAVGASKAHESTVNGTATMNLANGNWLIVETTPANSVSDPAVPTVLMLPMQNPDTTAAAGNKWFGTTSGSELNLYLKNLTEQGELTVQKLDPETGQGVAGADIALLKLKSGKTQADLQALINEAFYDLADNAAKLAAISTVAELYTPDNWEGDEDYPNPVTTTGTDGKASFADLMPEEDYYVLELKAPKVGEKQYVPNGDVQKVHPSVQTSDQGDTVVDGADGVYYYTGGTYKLGNYDTPLIDKKINVGGNYVDNDATTGIARGQLFNYKLTSDLNGNLEDYNSYVIKDTIPYQININEFDFSVTYTDADGNAQDQSLFHVASPSVVDRTDANGGDSGHGLYYDTDGTATPNEDGSSKDKEFTGANAAVLTFADGAETFLAGLGITFADGATTQEKIQSLIGVSGQTSTYTFDGSNQVATKGSDGNMEINVKTTLLDGLSKVVTDKGGAFVTEMTAQANSAAQIGAINNHADITVNTDYDTTTEGDDSKTFTAGWEFLKTDSNGNRLAGAGFDLARLVDSTNLATVQSSLLSGTNLGTAITPDNAVKMVQAMVDDGTWIGTDNEAALKTSYAKYLADVKAGAEATVITADKADVQAKLATVLGDQKDEVAANDFVYFAHLTFANANDADLNKQPVLSMDGAGMSNTEPMGDIFWTIYPALATTHTTGTDSDTNAGYLQYCGLPAGKYKLIETEVPDGYGKMADQKFSLGAPGTSQTSDEAADAEYPFLQNAGTGADAGKYLGQDGDMTGAASVTTGDYAKVINYEKSIFPLVGGLGTLFAVIAGLLAMGLALLKRKKDMKNEA